MTRCEQINKARMEARKNRDEVFFQWNGTTYSFPAFTLPPDNMLYKRVVAYIAGGKRAVGTVIGRMEDWRYGKTYYLIVTADDSILRAGKIVEIEKEVRKSGPCQETETLLNKEVTSGTGH